MEVNGIEHDDNFVLDAIKWHLKEFGYIDTNEDDFLDFVNEYYFEVVERSELNEH